MRSGFRFDRMLLPLSRSVLNLRLEMWNDLLILDGVLSARSNVSRFSTAEGVLRPTLKLRSDCGGTEDEVPGLEGLAEPKIELLPLKVSRTLEY